MNAQSACENKQLQLASCDAWISELLTLSTPGTRPARHGNPCSALGTVVSMPATVAACPLRHRCTDGLCSMLHTASQSQCWPVSLTDQPLV